VVLSRSGKFTLILHFNPVIKPIMGWALINGDGVLKLDNIILQEFKRKKCRWLFNISVTILTAVIISAGFGLQNQESKKVSVCKKLKMACVLLF